MLSDEACKFVELDKGTINPKCKLCMEKWNKFLDNLKGEMKQVRVIG